jgi:hypothetical protein
MVTVKGRQVLRVGVRVLLTLLITGLLAAPLAVTWGIGRAEISDYLGANEVDIAVDYTSETRIDLGPLGNAYLPSAYGPAGLTITVHGITDPETGSLLSASTLQSYLTIYTQPQEVIDGIAESLVADAVRHGLVAELVLMVILIAWTQRQHFLSARLVRMSRLQQVIIGYLMVIIVVGAVVIAPPAKEPAPRFDVPVADGTRFEGITVDSALLADLLDRGVKGLQTLADRQNTAVDKYVQQAISSLNQQPERMPKAEPDEDLVFGISDLHCSIAMTRFWRAMVSLSQPVEVFSAGDDTMNGTSTERFCATGQAAISGGAPFVGVGGNHDSAVTERQLREAGVIELDGTVTQIGEAGESSYLGDDDPEYNPPFSMERVYERDETEDELGERMRQVATGRNVDVLLVHQPAAARIITESANPPAKLIAWGHMHSQAGPQVILHDDGSWTVAIQLGTAGGVAAPTITSFSTPFSPPRTSADGYFFFRDRATGLITGVQPVHCLPDGTVIIDDRIPTGDLAALPPETRSRLGGGDLSPSPMVSPAVASPAPTDQPS